VTLALVAMDSPASRELYHHHGHQCFLITSFWDRLSVLSPSFPSGSPRRFHPAPYRMFKTTDSFVCCLKAAVFKPFAIVNPDTEVPLQS
jgi:hypothetical protein